MDILIQPPRGEDNALSRWFIEMWKWAKRMTDAANAISPYGSIYMEDGAQAVPLTAAGNYYRINGGMTTGACAGVTFQNARELAVTIAGKYLVNWSISCSHSVSDATIAGVVLIGSTAAQNTESATRAKENGVLYTIGGTGILTLAVGSVVSLGLENETGNGTTATVTHANMTLLMVGA